jgi:hypothetical protein
MKWDVFMADVAPPPPEVTGVDRMKIGRQLPFQVEADSWEPAEALVVWDEHFAEGNRPRQPLIRIEPALR